MFLKNILKCALKTRLSTITTARKHNHHTQCLGLSWAPMTNNLQNMPNDAIVAGIDTGNSTIYVGRVFHEGQYRVAKIIPRTRFFSFSFNGREIRNLTNFEVLHGKTFAWKPLIDHEIPPFAVTTGQSQDEQKLYIGRAQHLDSLTPGTVYGNPKRLSIPYFNSEHIKEHFEVLVHLRGNRCEFYTLGVGLHSYLK